MNELQVIIKESGLKTTKSQYILDQFKDYFEIASEWETRAKDIVVKSEDDQIEMKLARTARLFLRDKRIAIEKARVDLKADVIREGKAIEGISNILKGLIIPIEKYLETQEKFVEIKQAREAEEKRIEAEAQAELKRVAEEEARAKEQERIRLENIKLKKEADKREKEIAIERAAKQAEVDKKEAELAKERAKVKAESDKKEAEWEARIKADNEKAAKELKLAREEDAKNMMLQAKNVAEYQREQEEIKKRLEAQIECPYCHKTFFKEDNASK